MQHLDVYGQMVRNKETGELKPCRFCEAAKTYLTKQQIPFVYRDLSNAFDRAELLRRMPHVKSVPQIFVGDKLIGGFDDLAKLPLATLQQMIGE